MLISLDTVFEKKIFIVKRSDTDVFFQIVTKHTKMSYTMYVHFFYICKNDFSKIASHKIEVIKN